MLSFIKGLGICLAAFFVFLVVVAYSGHIIVEVILPAIVAAFP